METSARNILIVHKRNTHVIFRQERRYFDGTHIDQSTISRIGNENYAAAMRGDFLYDSFDHRFQIVRSAFAPAQSFDTSAILRQQIFRFIRKSQVHAICNMHRENSYTENVL